MKTKDKVIYTRYGFTFTLTDGRHDVWLGPISGYFYACPSSGFEGKGHRDIDDAVREAFGDGP